MRRKRFKKYQIRKYEVESLKSRHAPLGPTDLVLVLDGLKSSFNIPKIFRSANAFGVREVHLVGIDAFDPSPSKGAFRQTRSYVWSNFSECYASLKEQGYSIYAFDAEASESLGKSELPEKTAFVVGHEEYGLSFDPSEFLELAFLKIPQFGQVQSLNVAVAASIALYEYSRQHGLETRLAPRKANPSELERVPKYENFVKSHLRSKDSRPGSAKA